MSCYVCKKERGVEKCSRNECDKRACKVCLGKNDRSVVGGKKWVTCQNATEYYCSEHLIRTCIDCDTFCDGSIQDQRSI